MVMTIAANNSRALELELAWYNDVLKARLVHHMQAHDSDEEFAMPIPPDLDEDQSAYADFVRHYNMTIAERLVLLTSLIPHVRPQIFDCFLMKNGDLDRGFTEFGGLKGRAHSGFLPTGETVLFLLAGDDLEMRFEVQQVFDGTHFFGQHNIVQIRGEVGDEPHLASQLVVSRSFLDYLTTGIVAAPLFGQQFPAQKLQSRETWADLVLEPRALEQVLEIRAWLKHGHTVMNELDFGRRMKPGYRSLFYGPPGTGKSMTAGLIALDSGFDVYRIDLSMVISKYIGETEKNLARVFDYASHHNWILFFDEADALFGKRTATKDAHDRYANQETAYLLQRLEDYEGVAILATNQKDNIDDAFTRRFHTIIHFPMPSAADRKRIWRSAFSGAVTIEDDALLDEVAAQHKVSGGAIMNAARYAALKSAERGENIIRIAELEAGVTRELEKEGRTL